MKKTLYSLSLVLMMAIATEAVAQSASNFSTKKTAAKKKDDKKKDNKKDDKKNDGGTKKGADNSIKNKDAMFTEKNKAWVVGVHVGYPMVVGDVPSQFGIGYGFNVQKALGYSFALRAHFISGYSTGIAYQASGASALVRNNAVNGVNNAAADYFHNGKAIYSNYKMDFNKLSLDGVFYINNLNFNTENAKFLLYAVAGVGVFLKDTKTDQLDGSGNRYDYTKIKGDNYDKANDTYSSLKAMLDGKYETEADRASATQVAGQSVLPFVTVGLGGLYKLNERVSLSLEATYGFTGSDDLDGVRWYGAGVPTSNPDAFAYVNLGVNIRLGKTENISWYSNPLSLPYKTLMDNKKKLDKVDKLEKQVADMGKKMDTAMASIDSLLKDGDGDGVADYFDKEDSTPSGAVVDGAGRTIFFKDADGNLVYVDPNMANAVDNAKGGSGNGSAGSFENGGNGSGGTGNGTGNNGKNGNNGGNGSGNSGSDGFGNDGSGNNGNNGSNGSNNNGSGGMASNGGSRGSKTKFDKNSKAGKTVIYTNPSNKTSTVNNFAGTNSKLGFLPAVFFTTNSSDLKQTYYPQLYEIAKMLRQNPSVKMHVIGYTDKRASDSYNQKLGMRRAKATEYALTAYFGVNPAQLIPESKGKVDPLTNASSMGALAANRRVQFQIDGDNTGTMKSETGSMNNSESPVLTKSTTKVTKKANTKTPVTKTAPTKTAKTKAKPVEDDFNTGSDQNTKTTNEPAKTTAEPNKTTTPADTSKTKKEDVFTPGNDF